MLLSANTTTAGSVVYYQQTVTTLQRNLLGVLLPEALLEVIESLLIGVEPI